MRKLFVPLAFLLTIYFGYAQVGINTTTPAAQLEIKSTNQATPANNDGILIPKIDAFPVTNPTAAQNSMMVYLTTTSAGKQPGFYYWDNATTTWKGVGANTGWNLTGNTGTTPGTNFVGTTDDKDLVFKRNNTLTGKLTPNNVAFGVGALQLNTTGSNNIANGYSSLNSNTTGTDNVAIGPFSSYKNTTGSYNVSNGSYSLYNNINGSENVGIGHASLNANSSGINNVATGSWAATSNIDGNNNTAIGMESLAANKSGSSATAIGYQAMRYANNTTTTFDNKNVAVGYRSLFGSTNPVNNTGNNNTAIGYQSLLLNTSGNSNAALGNDTLNKNTTGSNNTANGDNALFANTTGSNNTALGNNTLNGNTTGSNNIAIGSNANVPITNNNDQLSIANVIYGITMNSTANGKIGIGTPTPTEKLEVAGKTKTTNFQMTNGASAGRVLVSDATGNGVWTAPGVATGGWALGGNAGTNESINFIGTTDYQSLIFKVNNAQYGKLSRTGGSVFFGEDAGLSNGGIYNIGIGYGTLRVSNPGRENVAIGGASMYNNVGGTMNVAVGTASLNLNTLGNFNTALGGNSLKLNTTGISNVATGHGALFNNTTGSANVSIGNETLFSNNAGSKATAIGFGAMYYVNDTSAYFENKNVAIGYNALYGSTTAANNTGNNNTVIGYQTLLNNTSGSNNIALGTDTLGANTTGSNNTALGNNTLAGNTTGTNNIAIGSNANVPTVNGNDQLSIANVIYGITMNSTSNGKIGIGTPTPTEKLHVIDNIKVGRSQWFSTANDRFIKFGDGNYATIGEEIADDYISLKAKNFLFNPSISGDPVGYPGNVGIGILTAPTEKLEVAGKTKTTNFQMTTGAALGSILTSDALGNATWQMPTPASNDWTITGNAGTNPAVNFLGTTDNNDVVFKRNNIRSGLLNLASNNTSFGVAALKGTTIGTNNTAIGKDALSGNVIGNDNIAIGVETLSSQNIYNSPAGNQNIAIGNYALKNLGINSYGADGMIAIGYEAMSSVTGSVNHAIAIGTRAMQYEGSPATDDTLNRNIALGYEALRGSTNVNNNNGNSNTAIGFQTLTVNTSGYNNSALGDSSLIANTTGANNTALGKDAGKTITTGNNNIVIGYDAQVSSATTNNQIRLGNTAITYAGIQVPWTITSDRRYKSNIQTSNLGLDFIKKLNPVSYIRKNDDSKKTEYGFIAQEVEQTLNELNTINSGIISKDDAGMYSVRYNDLLSPMVKAIQEQQQTIEGQQKIIEEQNKKIQSLEERIKKIESKLW